MLDSNPYEPPGSVDNAPRPIGFSRLALAWLSFALNFVASVAAGGLVPSVGRLIEPLDIPGDSGELSALFATIAVIFAVPISAIASQSVHARTTFLIPMILGFFVIVLPIASVYGHPHAFVRMLAVLAFAVMVVTTIGAEVTWRLAGSPKTS